MTRRMCRAVLKAAASAAICAILLTVMWRHAHNANLAPFRTAAAVLSDALGISRAQTSDEPFGVQGTIIEGGASLVTFPEKVQETVSDYFSWDADIIMGDDFDPDNFYACTAALAPIDADRWAEYFKRDGDAWSIEEASYYQRDGRTQAVGSYLRNAAGDSMTLFDTANYYKSDMRYISQVFDTNYYSPNNNEALFSKDSDLSFMTRQENYEAAWAALGQLGVPMDGARIMAEYSMDVDTLREQESVKAGVGEIGADERKASWSAEDEGYYYYVEQTCQGLSVFADPTMSLSPLRQDRAPLLMYAASSGFWYLNLGYWYDFDESAQKLEFLPFDEIKSTVDERYSKATDIDPLTVTECELVAYMKDSGDGTYELVPVWICTIAMRGEADGNTYEQDYYFPINALTGEEMYRMEV